MQLDFATSPIHPSPVRPGPPGTSRARQALPSPNGPVRLPLPTPAVTAQPDYSSRVAAELPTPTTLAPPAPLAPHRHHCPGLLIPDLVRQAHLRSEPFHADFPCLRLSRRHPSSFPAGPSPVPPLPTSYFRASRPFSRPTSLCRPCPHGSLPTASPTPTRAFTSPTTLCASAPVASCPTTFTRPCHVIADLSGHYSSARRRLAGPSPLRRLKPLPPLSSRTRHAAPLLVLAPPTSPFDANHDGPD
jgi:hypothetical protein